MLVRKGNEQLLENHAFINKVIAWEKRQNKFRNLVKIILSVRKKRYDLVVNAHRFASSGLITLFSRAKKTASFQKNPFSAFFSHVVEHSFDGRHEVERNQGLIEPFTDGRPSRPKLYPSQAQLDTVKKYQHRPYYCIAPASVWFTKQWPKEQWAELVQNLLPGHAVYLLGAPEDHETCEFIKANCPGLEVINLAGKLSLLESAALMKGSIMNYVNDSAPLHLASAMNAPVRAIYCSTSPKFGFGPLSDDGEVIEKEEPLYCKPCGIHGYATCPEGHFKCALDIDAKKAATL